MSDENVPPHKGDKGRSLPQEEDSISNADAESVPSETDLVLTSEELASYSSDEEEGLSEHQNDEESDEEDDDEDTFGDEVDVQLLLLNDMIQQVVNAGNVGVEEDSSSEAAPAVKDTKVKDVKEKVATPSLSTEEAAEMSYTDSDGTDGYDSSSASAPGSPSAPKRPKTKSNRCGMCNKKVGLTGIQCRCGGVYCAQHRYSNEHNCTFDYRELGAAEIRKNNPVVAGQKINKI